MQGLLTSNSNFAYFSIRFLNSHFQLYYSCDVKDSSNLDITSLMFDILQEKKLVETFKQLFSYVFLFLLSLELRTILNFQQTLLSEIIFLLFLVV
jgi:hypothetical protein